MNVITIDADAILPTTLAAIFDLLVEDQDGNSDTEKEKAVIKTLAQIEEYLIRRLGITEANALIGMS